MDKNNNTLSEVRKTAAQRMWDAENKQRAKSDASNKRTPSSIPVPDKKMKTEGATGAKPGWMLRQDPVLGNRVKAAQAKQKEFKKLVGTKVPVKEPVKEAIIEAHTEDDIANGGTVIYKHDGKHYMAKVSHKTGGGAGTMIHTTSSLGHKIKLNQVVSTDASDWTKFKNIKEETEQGVAEGLNEMDKTQTPPGRDGDIDWSKKQIHLGPAHVIKGKDVAQHALKALDKSMKNSHPNTLKKKGVAEAKDSREYDYEGDMAKSQLRSIIANAQRAHDMLEDDTNMAEWVQSKITLAADYISTVADYMQSEVNEEAKKGLYYNVNKRKKAGTSRSKNHPDAPSAQDWKDAAKTAKEEVELSELNKDTVISYAIRAHKDQDKQFTAIGKGIRNNDPKSANKASHKFSKRAAGLDRVETRLNKESKSFFDIRKELDERNLTPVEKIAREELSKMKYKKVRGAPTE